MSELDDFLSEAVASHVQALDAFHNGDPTPYEDMWSTGDPVTLFPPEGPAKSGREEVSQTFRSVCRGSPKARREVSNSSPQASAATWHTQLRGSAPRCPGRAAR